MDAHTLRVLEYPKVIAKLSGLCASALGRARAQALRPRNDPHWVQRRLAEVSEARAALQELGMVPLGGLTDIGELLARRGGQPVGGPRGAAGSRLRPG